MNNKIISFSIEEQTFHRDWSIVPLVFPGYTIIQRTPFVSSQDIIIGNYIDCVKFVFSLLGTAYNVYSEPERMRVILSKYRHQKEWDTLERGDIAIYGNSSGEVKHVGVYLGERFVLSKFGAGYVYRHPLNDVMPNYGKLHSFLKKLPETKVNFPVGV